MGEEPLERVGESTKGNKRIEWYTNINRVELTPEEEERRFHWVKVVVFLALSALSIYVVATRPFSLSNLGSWVALCGAILFPILAAVTLFGKDAAADSILKWSFLGPLILVGIILGVGGLIWAGTSINIWFATMPSWAVVIIVLLVLILFSRR